MTDKEFNASLAKLRLSVYASAPILGISLRQAQRYASGEQTVAEPVANYLSLLVDMIGRWKAELKKIEEQIAFFETRGAWIKENGKDVTKPWIAELRCRREEWLDMLRRPPNSDLPAQIDH